MKDHFEKESKAYATFKENTRIQAAKYELLVCKLDRLIQKDDLNLEARKSLFKQVSTFLSDRENQKVELIRSDSQGYGGGSDD